MTPGEIAKAALWVATWEGPFHCDPSDPGGATAYGISIRWHPEFTLAQLQALTVSQAATFLAQQYMPKGADQLPASMATPFLAFAVLEGTQAASKALQAAVGVNRDGDIGSETLKAVDAIPLLGQNGLLVRFYRACVEHLQGKPGWATDGAGWATRQMAASTG